MVERLFREAMKRPTLKGRATDIAVLLAGFNVTPATVLHVLEALDFYNTCPNCGTNHSQGNKMPVTVWMKMETPSRKPML